MPTFHAAQFECGRLPAVAVLVDGSYSRMSGGEKRVIRDGLRRLAEREGLAGRVVPVWEEHGGSVAFDAPEPWETLFGDLTGRDVLANMNRRLRCG